MKSIRFLDRRLGYSLASIGMVLGIAAPSIVPAFASADQLDDRSITLSSSAKGAQDVTYKVVFTPAKAAAAGVVINFCDDSPIPGTACHAPTGLDLTSVTTDGSNTVAVSAGNSLKYTPATALATGSAATITLNGITNPTAATTAATGFYARILTYSEAADTGYAAPDDIGSPLDQGGIAMAITDDIGVTAAVRETLTFCVSGAAIDDNCAGASDSPPSITLGHGTPKALSADAFDTNQVFTQISTNAAHGAVVNMKNSNSCGGLKYFGASVCDIAPANDGDGATGDAILAGTAEFGMQIGTGAFTGDTNSRVAASAPYNSATLYGMHYASDGSAGVTSAYGDTIYTASGPVNNVDVPMTFRASITNDTPAGLYTADMNLVATGTY